MDKALSLMPADLTTMAYMAYATTLFIIAAVVMIDCFFDRATRSSKQIIDHYYETLYEPDDTNPEENQSESDENNSDDDVAEFDGFETEEEKPLMKED